MNHTYCKIHKHVALNLDFFFWLKFVVLFYFFAPLLSPTKFATHLTLHFHSSKFIFYAMNNVLNENIIIFLFCYNCYKSKKLECQEEI